MGEYTGTSAPDSLALSARQVRKVYGGNVALADVDLDVRAGEIHGLLGENGAGKSTLVRLIAGIEPPDGGSISFFGEQMVGRFTPEDVAERGIGFIHQNHGLVEDLSVAENIALAAGYGHRGPFISWKATRSKARQALERMGLDIDPATRVGDLPVALRSLTSIARALALDLRVLVLDEPTATLGAHEVERLFAILRRLRDQGVALIMISHRLDEVLAITDRVTVLRDGRVTGVRDTASVNKNDLIRLIIGSEVPPRPERTSTIGAVAVSFRDAVAGPVGPLNFDAHVGEVLGITGLSGAGHTMVPRVLMGQERLRRGSITVDGLEYSPRSPTRAIQLVPADREAEGAVASMDLTENIYMNPAGAWARILRPRREHISAEEVLRAYDVRPPQPRAEYSTLSGGNAQKVVLARTLSSSPRVLVLEEPTAAVDVGARAEIHRRLRSIAAQGQAVILVSSDLDEIEQVCDRAIVMEQGRIQGELQGSSVTASALLEAVYGVHSNG